MGERSSRPKAGAVDGWSPVGLGFAAAISRMALAVKGRAALPSTNVAGNGMY